jgi:predicted transcriptional regulator
MMGDIIKRKQKPLSNTPIERPPMKAKVLLCFAKNGELNIYQISKLCDMGYSTAHSSIKTLEKDDLVQLVSTKENEKGVIAKSYDLTVKGVYQAITAKSPWREKIAIAEKRKELLGQNFLDWMKFIRALNDADIEKDVNSNIGYSITGYSAPTFLQLRYGSPRIYNDSIDDVLFDVTILTRMTTQKDVLDKVLNAVEKYPAIKNKLQKLVEEQIRWEKDELNKLETIKAVFEKKLG